MKTSKIINGLQILSQQQYGGDGYNVSAEHDELHCVTKNGEPVDAMDADILKGLGWEPYRCVSHTLGLNSTTLYGDYEMNHWTVRL